MSPLLLHDFHTRLGGQFGQVADQEVVLRYAAVAEELDLLRDRLGWTDLSYRSRLCLIGEDRIRFLHGQVSNQIAQLPLGQGCYACLLSAKGKMQSDLRIYNLPGELLLDFEPGLGAKVTERLEAFIIADDVQVVDAKPHYGLLGFWGPRAGEVLPRLDLAGALAVPPWSLLQTDHADWGHVYCVNQPRGALTGWELYVPNAALPAAAERLQQASRDLGGRECGWETLECLRIESGLPRYGQDMDETNLPPEAGLDEVAVSYTKGCYIGQEVLARVRTYGQVTKSLRGLRLDRTIASLPARGTRLIVDGKEAGYVTSAIHSPSLHAPIALGYVRREHSRFGAVLLFRDEQGRERTAEVVPLPFVELEKK